MAATLSSFIPPIFRTNLQPSERFEGDFSYSYSELPVFRSKFDNIKDAGEQRPKSTCGVVNNVPKSPVCEELYDNRDISNYEERKSISLPYQNVDRHISLPRPKFSVEHTNTQQKSIKIECIANEFSNKTNNKRAPKFKIIQDKGKTLNSCNINTNKCEETRKRFEFQTTCTNLPPKNIVDKEKSAGYDVHILNARLNSKSKCEEARKKFEFKTTCTNLPPKSLVKLGYNSCGGSPAKTAAEREKERKLDFQSSRVFSSSAKTVENNALKADIAAKDADKRNFPPKGAKKFDFTRSEDRSRYVSHKQPESIDFIDEISEFLNKSDYDTSDSNRSPFSPHRSLDSKDNSTGKSSDFENLDPKDCSAVASSVRRLRNSIFSSLKLPRKVSSKMATQQQLIGSLGRDASSRNYTLGTGSLSSNSKRKSAVELLAESKAFYVKSETVLDRKQELPLRGNSVLSSSTGAHYATLSGRHRRAGGEALQSQLRRLLGSTSMQSPNDSAHDPRGHNQYYTEKRTSRDCCEWEIPSHPSSASRSHYNSGTFSGNSSSGTSGSKGQVKSDPEHSRTSNAGPFTSKGLNRPSSSGDNRIFFPDSFVVPKPSRSDPANVFSNSFSIGSPFSSPEKIDARKILSVVDAYDDCDMRMMDPKLWSYDGPDLIEDFSTISPPAEYAITERSNYRYVRSNSHSHTMKASQDSSYAININSHKSLPDLHKQAEQFTEDGRLSGASGNAGNYLGVANDTGAPLRPPCDPNMRSSEALSSYSKATSGRSNRSSVFSSKGSDGHSRRSISCHNSDPSAGRGSADDTYYYNRSGSSYARDSGGSSGHCSGGVSGVGGGGPPSLRAPPRPSPSSSSVGQQRRDSGSSTQHSSARSHHRYSSYYDSYAEMAPDASHLEFHVSAPPQFQDGATTQFPDTTALVQPPLYSEGLANPTVHHHPHQQELAVNATVQICTNFVGSGPRSMHGATVTRVATGMDEGRGQTLVGIHFQASIPPVQFQDGQPPGYPASYGSLGMYGHRDTPSRDSRHMMPHRPSSSYNQSLQQVSLPRYGRPDRGEEVVCPPQEDNTASPPGLGNFRRQRCLRYKQRRPVLRSKSDISDRYWRPENKASNALMDKPSNNTPPSSTDNESPDRITRSQLDKFFDQLGMNDETYEQIILISLKKPRTKIDQQNNSVSTQKKSSPNPDLQCVNVNANCGSPKVYVAKDDDGGSSDSPIFSDISVADSNLIANNGDYTIQGTGPKDPRLYRSCEPPSIVERNARIIKWLCNCRKLQSAPLN